jgi:MarR family transcriptional regulator, organic hydroperoxide resistance regulator
VRPGGGNGNWKEAAMVWCPEGNQLDQEIFDAMAEFLGQLLQRGDRLAEQLGVPMFCLKALHRLGGPVTMSELGKQLHCDRSFVTMIADTLEDRGLARREPSPTDRRLKNLVLTPQGMELKKRLEAELLAQMPWSHALDVDERAALLELIRKMTIATAAAATPPAGAEGTEEVGARENIASPAAT